MLPFVINLFVLSIFEWPFYTGLNVARHIELRLTIIGTLYSGPQIRVTKTVLLISQPKHMLWVLKRIVSLSTQNTCLN